MRATCLADGEETASEYGIFEWSMQPGARGPGVHVNPEDHIFYVLTGTLSLWIDDRWTDAPHGSYAVIPGGVLHDFANRSSAECTFISINVPGGFEQHLPDIARHFAQNPPGDASAV